MMKIDFSLTSLLNILAEENFINIRLDVTDSYEDMEIS